MLRGGKLPAVPSKHNYVLEICSSEPVVSSPLRGKSEQSGYGLKGDAEDTEGDPTGDRLRVYSGTVRPGPGFTVRFALFTWSSALLLMIRRHTEDIPKKFHGLRYVEVSFSIITIRVFTSINTLTQ